MSGEGHKVHVLDSIRTTGDDDSRAMLSQEIVEHGDVSILLLLWPTKVNHTDFLTCVCVCVCVCVCTGGFRKYTVYIMMLK